MSNSEKKIWSDEHYVYLPLGKGSLAIFLRRDFLAAIKRGKSVLRNRALAKRQQKQEGEWEMKTEDR